MPSRRASEALPVLTLLKDFSRAAVAFSHGLLHFLKIRSFMASMHQPPTIVPKVSPQITRLILPGV